MSENKVESIIGGYIEAVRFDGTNQNEVDLLFKESGKELIPGDIALRIGANFYVVEIHGARAFYNLGKKKTGEQEND
jgi:hypothetical protein